MLLDLFHEVGLRLGANQLVYHFAIFNEQDSRNGSNAVIDGDLWVVVHVHFTYIHFLRILFGEFFNNGSDSAARSTPFSPKVNN